jgi:tight adherence protein B
MTAPRRASAPGRLLAVAAGLCCAALFASPAVAASTSGDSPTSQISKVSTGDGTVHLTLSVGNLPAGSQLDPASVHVTAGGQNLEASAVDSGTASGPQRTPIREAILTLDVSGSMKGDGIAAARAAAISYAKSLPRDVRVGLLTFSDAATLRLAPTTDRNALATAVGKVQAGGGTALYDGIAAAASAMDALPSDAVRRLVVLSDGDDTTSRHSLAYAIAALNHDKIAADVVAFRLPGNHTVLNQIAAGSHGTVLPAASASDLAAAFKAAASAFQQQLIITVTVPAALGGKTETLQVAANAGGQTVTASKVLELPETGTSSTHERLAVSAPAGSITNNRLWITVSLVFLALLVVLLYALLLPSLHSERAMKQARLAEMNRYRVIGALGTETAVQSAGPGGSAEHSPLALATLSMVDKAVRARGQRARVVEELDRAGLRMRPEEWVVLQVAAVLVGAVVLGLLLGIPGVFVGAVLAWGGMRVFVRTKIRRRADKFADQLPDTLQLIAGALRTGFSLNQALTGVVREGTEPTASEFARTLAEVRLGSDLEDAMDGTADRMRCDDLHWVVLAVRISREVGGNLAEVVTTTMRTMRQRAELRGQVRVLSAEGRISARILTALPFFVAAVLFLFRRSYLSPLVHNGAGIAMIVFGLVLLVLGSFWLSRIVKIKV